MKAASVGRYGFFVSLVALLMVTASARADVVTIRDPAFNLPHVCAETDAEAAREQGFEAARDRVAQFILIMNVARGTLHRALGNLGVTADDDIEVRRTAYSRSELNRMFARLPADSQALLNAYADGVNEAIGEMLKLNPTLDAPLELRFFKQNAVAGKNNLFGNKDILTQGEGMDPNYLPPGSGPFPGGGFQFTPELSMAFSVLQVRNFGFEAWNEIGMAEDLAKLIATWGTTKGTELWDDRYWINDPLAPVSVPDPTAPGFGGPLSKLSDQERIEIAKTVDRIEDRVLGRVRLPGYPIYDYSKAIEPRRRAREHRERIARAWGAWPAMGSYSWTIAGDRSATGNPWVGGFPQTGVQVPSLMHYSEMRGDTISANGMFFVGAPFALIGQSDHVGYTTTTALLKIVDSYIEQLVGGNFDLFKYNHHGTVQDMAKRIEVVFRPNGPAFQIPVFRTDVTCSANGCNGGDRPVEAFAGDVSGTAESSSATTLTDNDASFTPSALAGGHVGIVDGTGAGQIREITDNDSNTITVAAAWTTAPDSTSAYVAVASGNVITAVTQETASWMEEGTTAFGFSGLQKANDVLDVRATLRLIPSTHNFLVADNQPYNGIGTDNGPGNILYMASGFKRVRQNGVDPRLPLDGTAPNPFEIAAGTVSSATAGSLTDPGAFGTDLSAEPINFAYNNPGDPGAEYIVAITAGDGSRQTRRIASNTPDTLTLEYDWGTIPSPGDAYAVYEIWAAPEAINPSEGFTSNWNNKQSVATDIGPSRKGRNHRVELILEQLSLNDSVSRDDLRSLNKFISGITNPGTPGRYLLTRLGQALAAAGGCPDMTVYNELVANNDFPERGREFTNPLIVEPGGTTVADSVRTKAPDYIKNWATQLASTIYADEYDPAAVSKLTGDRAIGWVLHAIDGAAADLPTAYTNVFSGDYFNGAGWEQVLRDSFCDFVAANPTIGTKSRDMRTYNHPLAGLPCQSGCDTPIEFDPTPRGNRGTWEQIIEVGSVVKGEFIFPMGQSGQIDGNASGFTGNNVKQTFHTATLQPLWRDWRFAPMLHVCENVQFGVDEDGDTDGDGVVDGFENWYYGDLTNDASSDTDSDGADLATEYRWGSDPTLSDTDGDGVPDGNDVAPQDRLCIASVIKKLLVRDDARPGKDKIFVRMEAPKKVCIGSDNATPCETDADCGPVGLCRELRLNPLKDPMRIVVADDTPLLDAAIPLSPTFWRARPAGRFGGSKFVYKDRDGVNSPITKTNIRLRNRGNRARLVFQARDFDLAVAPDATQAVAGIAIGTRCFMDKTLSCKQNAGKLVCKRK